jgi:hypothetical protein
MPEDDSDSSPRKIEKGIGSNRPTLPSDLPKSIPPGFEVEVTEDAVRIIPPKPPKPPEPGPESENE